MKPTNRSTKVALKVALVTGASRGIGAATALLLAEQGYAVAVNYHTQHNRAEEVVNTIRANGGTASAFQADVANEEDVVSLFTQIQQALGTVTHLVNNAGMLMQQATLSDISLTRFNQVMQTNVNSCFLCCREALKTMTTGGAIVNVSSVAAKTGSPFEYIDYAASKGAIDTLTKGLALEVADKGIRVNGVRPGFIYTEMHASGGEPQRVDRLAPAIPMKRGGQAEEVAHSIAWLLSEGASYVTGSTLDVAGGRG